MKESPMSQRHLFFLALTTLITFATSVRAADPIAGRVTNVTLYRGQAQITRAVPIDGDPGSLEIVVGNLPEQVVPNSLFAEGTDAVEIRAVRFRTRAVGEEPREEVRALDRQILETQQQIDLTTKRQALLGKRTEFLTKLENFAVPTAQNDLSHGVLNAEALERITTFNFAQNEKIAEEEVGLAKQLHDLNEELNLLNRKRAEITAGSSRTEREAVLFLQKQQPGPTEVRLNYLVNNCGWSPAYTMRSGEDRKKVRVEYNALIHQLSGEDWNNVGLTLSTASPTLSAAGPGLAPFHVTLAGGGQINVPATPGKGPQPQTANLFGRGLSKLQVQEQLQGLNLRKFQSVQAANSAVAFEQQNASNWNLNDVAYGIQQLEING